MYFSSDTLIQLAILLLGVCGFMISIHIHKHKKENQAPLVCPIGFDCDTVVHSDYSKFMGVPVEFFGMIYYGLISITYFIFIFWGEILGGAAIGFLATASFGAFVFSLYLIIVQIFILKKGCSWCILSAFISAFIFLLTISNLDFNFLVQMFTA